MQARRSSALLIGAAALLGAVLVAAGVANWVAVGAASHKLEVGQAELIHEGLRAAIGRTTPSAEELAALLAADDDDSLSYVALVSPTGEVVAEAGNSVGGPIAARPFGPGEVVTVRRVGDRVRATFRRGARGRLRRHFGDTPTATQVVFEFVPREADALQARARLGVALSALAAVGALLLAGLYVRQRDRADAAMLKEEQSRRLVALGQMSAVLAHELRNPLASLKGHAQLLERALPEGEARREKAERVVAEAVRIERLVTDLLSFVRTGALDRKRGDVVALVRAVADERGNGRAQVAAPAQLQASFDAERLRQVLVNLVDNAVQAGEGAIEVTVAPSGGGVEISVRDHGAGIRDEDLPRLFEPFYTTRTQGTGLGLAIAKQIVELHGGSISVSNADGGGARFMLHLPKEG
jgi:two-component system sensor histidine kinase HydH